MLNPIRKPALFPDESVPDSEILGAEVPAWETPPAPTFHCPKAPRFLVPTCLKDDVDAAHKWLSEGIPVADVMTMLEFRHSVQPSPDAARSYAVEIIFRVWQENPAMQQPSQAHREESHHAIA